jgi:serine/threonine protein kinase/TolB-like protein
MTAERWQQIKTIFDSAVECEPSARAEFLRQHCGSDEDLQREVESLLASDVGATSLLGRPILGAAAMLAAPVRAATLVLKDRYEVERELGRGGMSVVYLARDRQLLEKRVVVKVLLEETNVDPWLRQKFQQEMEALARIDHPGVVGVLDNGLTADGKQFLVMQYIEGETLRDAMAPGSMDFTRAAGLIRQVGRALAAAHEKGVWHRDLKPENIMLQRLSGEEHVKLIDFGIAGIQNSQFGGEKTKVAGTVTYMAPEQFAGHACAASDTYALGVVAYEMLTGTKPFSPDSMVSTENKTQPAPPRDLRPGLPAAAERSILKAMSFRPEQRQAEVCEFSEELYHALSGTSSSSASGRKSGVPGTVEIAHVLFTDLVGYSLLPMDQQREYLGELQEIVQSSPQFRTAEAAGGIISLPTGDGMALAFFGDPTAPAQCALEVAAGLKSRPHLKLRMGIHSGPVYRVADVNANANVAGGGINVAQRVMDCGDAGHILLSKSVAEVLLQLSQWSPYLTDLGECTVKHGVKLHLYNLATAELGNRQRPGKLAAAAGPKTTSRAVVAAAASLLLIAAAAGAWWLGRSGKSSPPATIQASIAVLPFADMSPGKDQGYLSDGLADEVLNWLAKTRGLRVIARTSSFQFKGKSVSIRAIGEKLHVATILEGSVQKQGNRAKIAVQLIQAADESHLWSEVFNRDTDDVFAVEEEIARAVTAALKVTLLQEKTTAPSAASPNSAAYNAYLQGRYFFARGEKDDLAKAVSYFESAIEADPAYANAFVGLGESRRRQADLAYVPVEEGFRQSREAIERALVLDPNLGAAHAALGLIDLSPGFKWAAADASFQRAVALEPGNSRALQGAGALARTLGRFTEAVTLHQRATVVDPLSSGAYSQFGLALHYAGRQEEAKAAFNKALELDPAVARVHYRLGRVYLVESLPREALLEMEKEKHLGYRLCGLALAYHAAGRNKESDTSLAELIAKFQKVASIQIAEVYAFRGETDRALQRLEQAYIERDPGLIELTGNPLLKSLEHDARYLAFLKKMGLPRP